MIGTKFKLFSFNFNSMFPFKVLLFIFGAKYFFNKIKKNIIINRIIKKKKQQNNTISMNPFTNMNLVIKEFQKNKNYKTNMNKTLKELKKYHEKQYSDYVIC